MYADRSLTAVRCTGCGDMSFPARSICRHCHGEDIEEISLVDRVGEIVTFTTVRAPPPGVPAGPLQLAMVDLEVGIRALGRLEVAEPRVGMRVRTRAGVVRHIDGEAIEGLVFEEAAE